MQQLDIWSPDTWLQYCNTLLYGNSVVWALPPSVLLVRGIDRPRVLPQLLELVPQFIIGVSLVFLLVFLTVWSLSFPTLRWHCCLPLRMRSKLIV